MSGSAEFERLSAQVMRPARVAGTGHLTADPRRRFRATQLVACPDCGGRGAVGGYDADMEWEEDRWTCGTCGTVGSVAAPTPITERPERSAQELFDADPEGIARAEFATRSALERLVAWGVPSTEQIVWRVGGPLADPMRATMPHPRAEVLRQLFFTQWATTLDRVQVPRDMRWDQFSAFVNRAAWHLTLDRTWRAAAGRGLLVPSSAGPAQVVGQPIAELANPFAPLVDVWSTGYAFADIVDGAAVLIAPGPAMSQD